MIAETNQNSPYPDVAELGQMAAQFTPTPIRVDTSHLTPGDRKALVRLIEAAQVMDLVFVNQVWARNEQLFRALERDTSAEGQARARLFWISKGPWSTLEGHRAFIPGVPAHRPPGANFYPEDMTREEFETWVRTLPPKQAEAARGFFTVIRRNPKSRHLHIVPYHREYHADLLRASALLREAATLTNDPSLKQFLRTRAAAFLHDDYFKSDIAWMDLNAPIDITIGPYETYNDQIFGYKASFEAYVCLTDQAETHRLKDFSSHLQQVEDNLPLDPAFRNPKLGTSTPIRVVNEILSAGDGNHGVQTAAFNLPNDERIILQKGSKKVMLKNVQYAKFQNTLLPISRLVLPPAAQGDVSFDSFFTHILAHELSHGIGPQEVQVNGRKSSVRLQLKDTYSTIEEAKADVTGLFMLQYFFDRRILPGGDAVERKLYNTFLASAFRTLRFGVGEAHGRGMAIQFNYLLDRGAFVARPDGTFEVNFPKMKQAVRDLTHELLTIEARGDYTAAKNMLAQLGVMRPAVANTLNRFQDIPVDIAPIFITADELASHPQ
ncbi:MAG: MutT/NUDIX family protein [Bryobacterales bacterium]|nr:MutT/NUDIX family protein [Bryobacterales bacterium]